MTDQGRIPESGLSPYVHMLEAELAKLRDDLRHADEAYARVAAERDRLGAERDTLLAALREIERGTYPGMALTPSGPLYQTKKRMGRGMMRRIARAAISEVEEEK